MTIKAWNALLTIALLICLAGGGYILYMNDQQKQAELAAEQVRLQEEAQSLEAQRKVRLQRFEDFLNAFLQDVAGEAKDYKKSRIVLNDLSKPENMQDPQYISENARLAESTVMSLQLKITDIMGAFEVGDEKAQILIADFEGDVKDKAQASWGEIRDDNAAKYGAYFSLEQALLNAELKLIEFYDTHKDGLSVDEVNERVLFEDIALMEQDALLRGEIISLRAAQRDALKATQTAQ